jgi:hypothetical protein
MRHERPRPPLDMAKINTSWIHESISKTSEAERNATPAGRETF